MKIQTRSNHVAVEVLKENVKNEGGIYMSPDAEKRLLVKAKVLSVPGQEVSDIKVGDTVLVYKPRGQWYDDILFVESPFIVAKLNDEEE